MKNKKIIIDKKIQKIIIDELSFAKFNAFDEKLKFVKGIVGILKPREPSWEKSIIDLKL